jgi:hypothetical protein
LTGLGKRGIFGVFGRQAVAVAIPVATVGDSTLKVPVPVTAENRIRKNTRRGFYETYDSLFQLRL